MDIAKDSKQRRTRYPSTYHSYVCYYKYPVHQFILPCPCNLGREKGDPFQIHANAGLTTMAVIGSQRLLRTNKKPDTTTWPLNFGHKKIVNCRNRNQKNQQLHILLPHISGTEHHPDILTFGGRYNTRNRLGIIGSGERRILRALLLIFYGPQFPI